MKNLTKKTYRFDYLGYNKQSSINFILKYK